MTINFTTELLPILEEERLIFRLDNATQRFHIDDVEKLDNLLTQFETSVENYVYQEEDRQLVKKIRASVNKFKKNINSKIRTEQKLLFEDVTNEQAMIQDRLDSIIEKIERGVLDEDNRYKEEKRQELETVFREIKSSFEQLRDLNFIYDDVAKSNFLNRTTPTKKATNEIFQRLTTYDNAISQLKNEPYRIEDLELLRALKQEDFDGLSVISTLKAKYEAEQARIKVEVERQVALKEKEKEKEKELGIVRIEINQEDLERVKALLGASQITFKICD